MTGEILREIRLTRLYLRILAKLKAKREKLDA